MHGCASVPFDDYFKHYRTFHSTTPSAGDTEHYRSVRTKDQHKFVDTYKPSRMAFADYEHTEYDIARIEGEDTDEAEGTSPTTEENAAIVIKNLIDLGWEPDEGRIQRLTAILTGEVTFSRVKRRQLDVMRALQGHRLSSSGEENEEGPEV